MSENGLQSLPPNIIQPIPPLDVFDIFPESVVSARKKLHKLAFRKQSISGYEKVYGITNIAPQFFIEKQSNAGIKWAHSMLSCQFLLFAMGL